MNMRSIDPTGWQHSALELFMLVATSCSANAKTFDPRDPQSPLHLVRIMVLPDVRGRIDHLALDPHTNHLFIAELGNGTVDDVDLTSGMIAGRILGLHEPQGVAWVPAQKEIAVTCGDGSVRFYRRSDRKEVARISLGDDADNVRVDSRDGRLVVGYGSGGLAVIDPATHSIVQQLKLPRHPEAFVILGSRVFVNVPDARQIVLADLDEARVVKTLSTGTHFGNYPMASNTAGTSVAIAFRIPGTLSMLNAQSISIDFSIAICGDADDIYFHAQQIIVVCGEGAVQLIDGPPEHGSVRVATSREARTGLLDPEGSRLFIAVPAGAGPAAIWELSFAEMRQQSQ